MLLESIWNVQLDDNAWTQASLPITAGGLGIRSFARLAPSASLAPAAGSSQIAKLILPAPLREAPIHHQSVVIDHWRVGHNADAPLGPIASCQKAWDTPLVEASLSALTDNSAQDPQSKARLLAVQRKESGAWLTAMLHLLSDFKWKMILSEWPLVCGSVHLFVSLISAPSAVSMCTAREHMDWVAGRVQTGIHAMPLWMTSSREHLQQQTYHVCWSQWVSADQMVSMPMVSQWSPGREANPLPGMLHVTFLLLHTFHVLPLEPPRLPTKQRVGSSFTSSHYHKIAQSHFFMLIEFKSLGVFGDSAMSFLKELVHHIWLKTADPQSFHQCQTISATIPRLDSVAILGSIVNDLFN